MKVLFDHQIYDSQEFGGISRYFFELFNQFDKNSLLHWDLPLIYSNNYYLKALDKYKDVLPKSSSAFFPHLEFKGKGFLHRMTNRMITPADRRESESNKSNSIEELKKGNFDIFHPTYYDDYFLQYLNGKPFVLTVHDCIHEVFPEYIIGTDKVDKNQQLLDKASRIIAISENTKRDLVSLYSVDESKIDVIYLANSLASESSDLSETFSFKLPSKFLLFVGGRGDYKNFLFFLQIFSVLNKIDKSLSIICTGPGFTGIESDLIKKHGLEGSVYQTFVNDGQLSFLYKKAIAFVYPTLYEGFGLPVLEAFHNGCPAVISRTSSLSEIAEDAAIFFEPKVPESMLDALKSVLFDKGLRERKVMEGYKQERKFSWQQTGVQTQECYKRAIESSNN